MSRRGIHRIGVFQRVLFALALILCLFLSLRNFSAFQVGVYMDDARYVVLARSIASGPVYGFINAPGEPGKARFPFGFPLLLSPWVSIFQDHLQAIPLVSLAFTLLNMTLLYWCWPRLLRLSPCGRDHREGEDRWWGLAVAALYGLSRLGISHTRMVMSEPAFTAFVLASLILAQSIQRGQPAAWRCVLLGALSAFVPCIRTIGVVLWVSALGSLLMTSGRDRVRRIAAFLEGGILLLGAIVLFTPVRIVDLVPAEYVDQLQNPGSYGLNEVKAPLLSRCVQIAGFYVGHHLREAVVPLGGGERERAIGERIGLPFLPAVTGAVIGGLVLLGALASLRGSGLSYQVHAFEGLYLAALCFWPWHYARFLYPILPFLTYHFLVGVAAITSSCTHRLSPRGRDYREGLAVLLVSLLLSISLVKGIRDHDNSLSHTRDFRAGSQWIRKNTPPDALIMAEEPETIYLYSNRKTLDFPRAGGVAEWASVIRKEGVDCLLLAPSLVWTQDGSLRYGPFVEETLLPLLREMETRGWLKPVMESEKDKVRIYEVLPECLSPASSPSS